MTMPRRILPSWPSWRAIMGLANLSMGMSGDFETGGEVRRHACAGGHGDFRCATNDAQPI